MKTKTATVVHYTAFGTCHRFSRVDYRGTTVKHFDHDSKKEIFDYLLSNGFTHGKIQSRNENKGIVITYTVKLSDYKNLKDY